MRESKHINICIVASCEHARLPGYTYCPLHVHLADRKWDSEAPTVTKRTITREDNDKG